VPCKLPFCDVELCCIPHVTVPTAFLFTLWYTNRACTSHTHRILLVSFQLLQRDLLWVGSLVFTVYQYSCAPSFQPATNSISHDSVAMLPAVQEMLITFVLSSLCGLACTLASLRTLCTKLHLSTCGLLFLAPGAIGKHRRTTLDILYA
jgi:hypothetical protein